MLSGENPDASSKSYPDRGGKIPLEQMAGDDEEDAALLREMAERAENFMRSFSWCLAIRESSFGAGIGKIITNPVVLIRVTGTFYTLLAE